MMILCFGRRTLLVLLLVFLSGVAFAQPGVLSSPELRVRVTAVAESVFQRPPQPCPGEEAWEESDLAISVCFGSPSESLETIRNQATEQLNLLDVGWGGRWEQQGDAYLTGFLGGNGFYLFAITPNVLAVGYSTFVVNDENAAPDAPATSDAESTRSTESSSDPTPEERNEQRRACIQANTILEPAFVEVSFQNRPQFQVAITNNLPWAIAGVRLAYTIRSADRAVPWEEETIAMRIRGGIEPNETRSIGISTFLPMRAYETQLTADVTLLDVVDPELNLFVADQGVSGWNDTPSTRPCTHNP